jgi:hypothetical protein
MRRGRDIDGRKYDWLCQNRGVLARIARETGWSAPFISDVFWLRRKSSIVADRFMQLGAPGFKKREVA